MSTERQPKNTRHFERSNWQPFFTPELISKIHNFYPEKEIVENHPDASPGFMMTFCAGKIILGWDREIFTNITSFERNHLMFFPPNFPNSSVNLLNISNVEISQTYLKFVVHESKLEASLTFAKNSRVTYILQDKS